jgi:hypothetical protein
LFVILVLSVSQITIAQNTTPNPAARWLTHIQYLASDELAGGETGSKGHRRAAQYIATAFKRAGLKPGGMQGYFQTVKFISERSSRNSQASRSSGIQKVSCRQHKAAELANRSAKKNQSFSEKKQLSAWASSTPRVPRPQSSPSELIAEERSRQRDRVRRRVPDPFGVEDIEQEVSCELVKPIPQHCEAQISVVSSAHGNYLRRFGI